MIGTYKVAVSSKTNTYYMQPYKVSFSVFTDENNCHLVSAPEEEDIFIVETDIEDINELDTMLYNAGFQRGTIDSIPHIISKPNINYTNVNKNEIMLAQYILTNDQRFLKEIDTKLLYTLVQIDQNNKVYYPTIKDKNGVKVLVYTSPFNIPNDMFIKYKEFTTIKVGQLGKDNYTFLINNQFPLAGGNKNGRKY